MRLHPMALLPLTALSATCTLQPLPRRTPGARVAASAPTPTGEERTAVEPTPEWVRTIAPRKLLEEGMVGDASGLTPAPQALGPSPTPTAASVAALAAPAAGSPVPGATSPELDSVLAHIGPTTPPNVAAALRLIEDGRQQMQQGRYDRALDRFERALAIDPSNAYGYYFLAQLHFATKKYDQAVAFASRAVVLSARTDPVLLGRSYGLQGAAFEAVGRYPDARKAYEKAIEADPNNLAARVGMARLRPDH
ncbi:MAG TPA: tetratricopeptide repeat protein [Candidatus Margulisiibacteriota bacterium]|nr:tetratricopeptide repeat protein [Candidatus Margulisiibacteriota bacterium]